MLKLIATLALGLTFNLCGQEAEVSCECPAQLQIEKSEIIPLPDIREADVMWSTTIWREIDLRQKINHPYYFPLDVSNGYTSLFQLMTDEISVGCMNAYRPSVISSKSEFSDKMTCAQLDNLINPQDSIQTIDIATNTNIWVPNEDPIEPEEITRYRIKEQWIFDKQHSRMTVRTIGIAPMNEVRGEDGSFRGYSILFWINYPESREVLAKYPVHVRQNDNKALNFDDMFAKRYYDGFIVKESNVYDRNLKEYVQGVDFLIEGEEIEKKIRDMESDVWSY